MKQFLPIVFAILAGFLLAIIAIKNNIPFWGGLLSSKIKVQLDKTDRYLALIALFFFILSMIFLVLNM